MVKHKQIQNHKTVTKKHFYMFTKIITAITLAVICISAVTNINTSASFGGSIRKDWIVNIKSDLFTGSVSINPAKSKKSLAKTIGNELVKLKKFQCRTNKNCDTLIQSTDLLTPTFITPVNGEYTVVLELVNPINLMN